MSGCLIFQRPDICSTTSLESIRTSTSAVGSRSSAACRPATRPPYSATLLVARPTDAGPLGEHPPGLGVPHQRAVAGRAGVAPRPAVRLDDEAASHCSTPVSIRSSVAGAPCDAPSTVVSRSQPGLGRAHQDPAAVLAAHDLVRVGVAHRGQLVAVQLDPAALARARLEQRGAGGCRSACGSGRTATAAAPGSCAATSSRAASCRSVLSAMSASASSRSWSARSQLGAAASSARSRGGERRVGGLPALHELEHLVLQVGLAPLERVQLVLEVGRSPWARRCRSPAASGPWPPAARTVSTSDSSRSDSRSRSRTSVSARTTSAEKRPLGLLGGLDRGVLGQGPPAVGQLGRARRPRRRGPAASAARSGRPAPGQPTGGPGLPAAAVPWPTRDASTGRCAAARRPPPPARRGRSASTSGRDRQPRPLAWRSGRRRTAPGPPTSPRVGDRVVLQVAGQQHVGARPRRRPPAATRRCRRRPRPGGRSGRGPRPPGRRRRSPAGRRPPARRTRAAVIGSRQRRRPGRGPRPAVVGVGSSGTASRQPEDGGQRVVDAVVGGPVGVGVRDEQRGAGPDQPVHQPALRVVGGHPVHRGEQQRVVGDEQVGAGARSPRRRPRRSGRRRRAPGARARPDRRTPARPRPSSRRARGRSGPRGRRSPRAGARARLRTVGEPRARQRL